MTEEERKDAIRFFEWVVEEKGMYHSELAIEALKAYKVENSTQEVKNSTDTISRQAAIDALETLRKNNVNAGKELTFLTGVGAAISVVDSLSSAQPKEAIAVTWINKHLEWLDNCDNDFAQLARVSIRAMVEIWKKDRI